MNHPINHIKELTEKESRVILGCLSGTSLDGFDMGLFKISGSGTNTFFECIKTSTVPYDTEIRALLNKLAFKQQNDLKAISQLNTRLGFWYASQIQSFLKSVPGFPKPDIIGSHGQTIFHAPDTDGKFHGTLQLGDGDIIASETGIPVISDFRMKEIAAGGEGAPLSPFADYILFRSDDESRVILNIGGISNGTVLPKSCNFSEIIFADFGPGNTLMDTYARKLKLPHGYDKDGAFASQGNEDIESAKLYLKSYKHKTISSGPEDYLLDDALDFIKKRNPSISEHDMMATFSAITVESIVSSIKALDLDDRTTIYVCGGGASNAHLMEILRERSDYPVKTTGELGVDPDFRETLLFAILANEWLAGTGFPRRNKSGIRLGKLSLP